MMTGKETDLYVVLATNFLLIRRVISLIVLEDALSHHSDVYSM